jgi:hypothetical protein
MESSLPQPSLSKLAHMLWVFLCHHHHNCFASPIFTTSPQSFTFQKLPMSNRSFGFPSGVMAESSARTCLSFTASTLLRGCLCPSLHTHTTLSSPSILTFWKPHPSRSTQHSFLKQEKKRDSCVY